MNPINTTDIYSFKPFQFQHVNVNPTCTELPSPRSGHRILCTAKHMFVYGGYNSLLNPPVCRDMWKFNFATRKWRRYAENQDIPVEVASAVALRRKSEILIFGGTGVPFGFYNSNKLHSFNVNDKTESIFTYEISGRPPLHMYGQAMVLRSNLLYVIGGTDGFTFTCDIHRVNLNKDQMVWKQIYKAKPRHVHGENEDAGPYEPEGRYRHEVGIDGNDMFLIGGGNTLSPCNLTEISVFNIPSRTWRRETTIGDASVDPSYPLPRRFQGFVQLKFKNVNYIYIVCGLSEDGVLNDLWRLNLCTLQWTLVKSFVLPNGLYFHSTALSRRSKIYIFGGIKDDGNFRRTNDIYCGWLCIPKLSEICWDAVLHYVGNKNVSKNTLKRLNVPKCFIDRIS